MTYLGRFLMNHKLFTKTKVATSLSLIIGATSLTSPAFAYAEEASAKDKKNDKVMEVIEVTGIRSSLIRAMDMKRGSQGVVDGISAEDIGKFPDTNLAESLQRITGVSIDRQNGEGSKVTVRGFGPDFNLVTLNGRQMPVTTGSRSFDFANIAAEGVIGVEVHKTSDATNATGGIGSTINVLTFKPLNAPGEKAKISVKAVNDTSTSKGNITPEFSGLYSNTFDDDRFGVAISASYQKRESGNKQANVGTGWRSFPGTVDNDWGAGTAEWGGVPQDNQVNRPGPDDIYSVPQTTIYKFEEQQRERINGQLTFQYKVNDDITASLDYTFMQNDVESQYHDVSAWYTFAPSSNVWTDGPVASPLIYSETYDTPQDLSMAAGGTSVRNSSGSLGLNVEWQVSDELNLTFDAHSSNAKSKPNDPLGSSQLLSMAGFVRTSAATDFSKDLPVLSVGGGNSVKPSDMRVTGSVFGNAVNQADVDQVQVDGTYVLENGSSIDFGVASTNVTNHSQSVNVQRNDWGGVGQAGDFEDSWFPSKTIHDQFDISGGDFSLGNGNYEILDTYFEWDYHAVRDRAAQLYTPSSFAPGTLVGDCGNLFCASTQYDADTDRKTKEESVAVYAQYNMDGEISEMPFDLHLGLRYEKTDVTSTSAVSTYNGANWVGDTEIVLNPTGEREFQTKTGSYDYWLPNIDFNMDVTDDVIVRASISKTIGRPDYVSIQGGTVVGTIANRSGGSGSAGNPDLLPLESTNYDLSAEWYYDESSYVSIGYFRKDTKNFIANSQVESTIYNIPNPADGKRYQEALEAVGSDAGAIRQWIFDNYPNDPYVDVAAGIISGNPSEDNTLIFKIDQPSNGKDSKTIDGWEFAVQHIFADSGFGIIANYTMVDSGLKYNNFLLEDQEALIGLSDTANAVLFYDKDGLQARLAYNWRDEFLNSRGQGTGANPQYTEPYSQLDFNVSYDIKDMKGLTVFFEGINITDEYTRVHGRSKYQVLNVTQLGARYNVGVRYTF
jgi:TonB-dependent receptor